LNYKLTEFRTFCLKNQVKSFAGQGLTAALNYMGFLIQRWVIKI